MKKASKKEKAIILCGGLGTRLRETIGERQKTMAEVKGVPFLLYIINYLKNEGVNQIIFACGYKSEEIVHFFGNGSEFGIVVSYSAEFSPLGTGGAIRNALKFLRAEDDRVFILNGDTDFRVELDSLINNMEEYDTDCSIAIKEIKDKSRYGSIKLKKNNKSDVVISFDEKVNDDKNENVKEDDKDTASFINGGIYLMKKELIQTIEEDKNISLEKELFPLWIKEKIIIGGVVSDKDFVDIGTKASYESIR